MPDERLSLLNFIGGEGEKKTYDKFSSSTLRILNLVNISGKGNLEGDSGIRVSLEFMKTCLKKNKDYFFYVMAPPETSRIYNLDNMKLIPYTGPLYRRMFASYSDPDRVKDLLMKQDYRYDIFWNNQPEVTIPLQTTLLYETVFAPQTLTYNHWLAVPEASPHRWEAYRETFYPQLMTALYTKMFVNSNWAKNRFIHFAKDMFTHNLGTKIGVFPNPVEDILLENVKPLTLGVDLEEKDKFKETQKYSKFTVMFNHRWQTYTGFSDFSKMVMDAKRTDMNFIFTNPVQRSLVGSTELAGLSNVRTGPFDRETYIRTLWKSDVAVSMHPNYSAWSLSTVDAMACGLPVIVPRQFAFPEIVGDDYSLFYDDPIQVFDLLIYLKDNPDVARAIGAQNRVRVEKMFDWNVVIDRWTQPIEEASQHLLSKGGVSGASKTVKEIHAHLQKQGVGLQSQIWDVFSSGANKAQIKIGDYIYVLKHHKEVVPNLLENCRSEIASLTAPKNCVQCGNLCKDKMYVTYTDMTWRCESCFMGMVK